jgi:hypothetical protein
MDVLTQEQLRELIEAGRDPCVSITMPTHRSGRDVRQDPVQLKNLLNQAEQQLIARGMRPTLARDMIDPLRGLIEERDFWLHSRDGLVAFLSEGFHQVFRVPIELDEAVVVNTRFYLKPLVPLLAERRFNILGVSLNGVRLHECYRHSHRELEIPEGVSRAFDDAISKDDRQTNLQWHSSHTPSPASVGAIYHQQNGEHYRNQEEDIHFFFRQLEEGILGTVIDRNDPLVLAATENIESHYRKVSKHPTLYPKAVRGNPEHVRIEVLHRQALDLLEQDWQAELSEMRDRYGTAASRDLASSDIAQILPAAAEGRVDVLFLPRSVSIWGTIDPDTQRVTVKTEASVHDVDLVDEAAIRTLLANGRILVVDPSEVPGEGEVAAIYRY